MNKLSKVKRAKILCLLVEGMSMRSISRAEDTDIGTVARLLDSAGKACKHYHNKFVRGIKDDRYIQCDEVWSFVYAKEKRADYAKPWDKAGTVWTWTALDTDTKLLVAYKVRKRRDARSATALMRDLARRLDKTPILVADQLKAYRKAAREVFGKKVRLSQKKSDPDTGFTTAHVERHNLTIRMCNRRFNRKTNAFSKKFSRHVATIHLFMLYYNFVRIHKTLRVTPAMEAELTDTLHDFEWIVELIDSLTPPPKKPGPAKGTKYRPRRN